MATPQRRRARSPVGRRRISLGDVSGARAAGSSDVQREQRIYLNTFADHLAKVYPEKTLVEPAQTKLASFIVPVTSSPSVDFVDMVQKVKKTFPAATCTPGSSPGECVWELPYVRTEPARRWGNICFLTIMLAVLCLMAGYCFSG